MKEYQRIKNYDVRITRSKALVESLPKFLLVGVPVACALVIAGVVHAAIGVVAPVSLDYAPPPPINTTMQSFTIDDCKYLQTYTTVVLTDTRNTQQYRIRKMPDGKCWMIDNLKLGARVGGFDGTITPSDSNVSANFTLPPNPVQTFATRATNGICHSSNSAGNTGSSGNLTCDGGTSGTTGNPANTNFNFIAWSDPSDTTNAGSFDGCLPVSPGMDSNSLSGCGYLYNWFTATAGSGTYAITTGDVTQSICPAGWRLPSAGAGTANAANEFAVLNGAMSGGAPSITSNIINRANWRSNGPFSGVYSGQWNSPFNFAGYSGNYWSSSAATATAARSPYFVYNTVYPGNTTGSKYWGHAIRCLL